MVLAICTRHIRAKEKAAILSRFLRNRIWLHNRYVRTKEFIITINIYWGDTYYKQSPKIPLITILVVQMPESALKKNNAQSAFARSNLWF